MLLANRELIHAKVDRPEPRDGFAAVLDDLLAGVLPVELHLQPIVDLEGGCVTGYEALARFPPIMAPTPDLCFRLAGLRGRRVELEDLTFRQALQLRRDLPANVFLSLNIGPEYLLSEAWLRAEAEFGDLGGVVLEITEESSILDYREVRKRVDRVRAVGGCVAVDDAGAGYASLNHILEIRPEFIKVDRRFVQNCQHDRAKSTLIEMMGAAANRLDAWIVAEGVEVPGELEELLLLGVPLAQGYLLGRPHPTLQSLSPEVHGIFQGRHTRGAKDGLPVEVITLPLRCGSVDEGIAVLRKHPEHNYAVVIDTWDRPLRLVQRHRLLGVHGRPLPLRVQVESEPGEVLQRAMNRDEHCRFDPILVIGPEGDLRGLLEVDRLMQWLLRPPSEQRRRSLQ